VPAERAGTDPEAGRKHAANGKETDKHGDAEQAELQNLVTVEKPVPHGDHDGWWRI
jgi:hypothetical protein